METKVFIDHLQANYDRVFNYLGGGMKPDILIGLASKYTLAGATYSGVAFQRFVDELHHKSTEDSWFSIFNNVTTVSSLGYKVAAHLLLHPESEQQLEHLGQNEHYLQEAGFKKNTYRTIAALLVLDQPHVKRARQLYDEMHKFHPLLTGKDDVSFAVFLTTDAELDFMTRAATMNRYYEQLKGNGFKIGDALQALSQLLTIYSIHYEPNLVPYVTQLKKEFEQHQIKVKKIHYPYIGLLALVATDTKHVHDIVALYKELNVQKMFGGAKELALIVAIQRKIQQLQEVKEIIALTDLSKMTQAFEICDLSLDTLQLGSDFFGSFIGDLFN